MFMYFKNISSILFSGPGPRGRAGRTNVSCDVDGLSLSCDVDVLHIDDSANVVSVNHQCVYDFNPVQWFKSLLHSNVECEANEVALKSKPSQIFACQKFVHCKPGPASGESVHSCLPDCHGDCEFCAFH